MLSIRKANKIKILALGQPNMKYVKWIEYLMLVIKNKTDKTK